MQFFFAQIVLLAWKGKEELDMQIEQLGLVVGRNYLGCLMIGTMSGQKR
jgi:hypothetical protein